MELLRLDASEIEFSDAKGRRNHAHARPARGVSGSGLQRVAIRIKGIEIPPFAEEQIAKLELNFGGLRERCGVSADGERGGRNDDRGGNDTAGTFHGPP